MIVRLRARLYETALHVLTRARCAQASISVTLRCQSSHLLLLRPCMHGFFSFGSGLGRVANRIGLAWRRSTFQECPQTTPRRKMRSNSLSGVDSLEIEEKT